MGGDGPLVVVGVGDAGEAVAVNWSAGSATEVAVAAIAWA